MLVIDDSKLKLLKMKEKMLALAVINFDKTLASYRDLALEIDKDCYKMIIKQIEDSDYSNLPLEEQIKFYLEIIEDYDYLNELQYGFRRTYSEYSDESLELSDLSNINIEDVKTKASQLEGYLMNIKNLKSNKIELDRLNKALLKATKAQDDMNDMALDIQRKLKDEVINARGRRYGKDGNLEVTSIALELKKFDIDLNAVAIDGELLDKLYGEARKEREDARELLDTALDLPNRDDSICSSYMRDLLISNYKFNLMELVKEIFTSYDDINLFRDSLYKVEDLIKEIKNGLRELGVKFYINPFDNIKIKKYLGAFEKFDDQSSEIEKIKQTMAYLSEMIDDMEKTNNELLLTINDPVEVLNERAEIIPIDTLKEEEEDEPLLVTDAKDNQVIRVSNFVKGFKKERALEKTSEVIRRVYAMLYPKEREKTPELIIEKGERVVEKEPVVFKEVTPFEEPVLFDDRKDSAIFEDEAKVKKEPEIVDSKTYAKEQVMPEIFWIPKEEEGTESSEKIESRSRR